jgi:hypothetical protein
LRVSSPCFSTTHSSHAPTTPLQNVLSLAGSLLAY